LALVGSTALRAGETGWNNDYNGIWKGTRIITYRDPVRSMPERSVTQHSTIIIFNGGKLIARIGGACPGRAEPNLPGASVSLGADGQLIIKTVDALITLKLSPDKQSLIENGTARGIYSLWAGGGANSIQGDVPFSGVFHREK
jgi:hypothetical protein